MRARLCSSGQSLSTAPWREAAAAPSAGNETATASVLGEVTTALVARTTVIASAATAHATTVVEAAAIGIGAGTTFFDVDLFSTDVMRVSCDSCIVASCIGEFNESAILMLCQSLPLLFRGVTTEPTFCRLTSKYTSFPN